MQVVAKAGFTVIRKAILNQLEVFEIVLLAKLSQKTSHKPKKREETLRIPRS